MSKHRLTHKCTEGNYYGYTKVFRCRQCGEAFYSSRVRGMRPMYCSNACKQKAYRESKRGS